MPCISSGTMIYISAVQSRQGILFLLVSVYVCLCVSEKVRHYWSDIVIICYQCVTVNTELNILNTLSDRNLRWLGHTIRMDHSRITHQALYWEVPGFKRGPGRPRTNWRDILVKKHLRGMGLIWEEAEVVTLNRQEWHRSVAQYVHVDVGWIKSSQVTSSVMVDPKSV